MEPYANSRRERKRRGRERERNHEREKKTITKKEERFNGEDKTGLTLAGGVITVWKAELFYLPFKIGGREKKEIIDLISDSHH